MIMIDRLLVAGLLVALILFAYDLYQFHGLMLFVFTGVR